MNRLDLIKLVQDPAKEVMHNKRILASILIAESVVISESKKEILYNNPLDMRNLNTDKLFIFDSIEDCFDCFVENGIKANGYEGVIGNYDYKSVVEKLNLGPNRNSVLEIIESYKLYDIDKEVLDNIYSGKRSVIEIDHTPFLDIYRVRKSYSDKDEKIVTNDLDEAKAECDKYLGYSVFNSRGKAVYTNVLTEEAKAKMELEERIPSIVPKTGSKIHLNAVNLYLNPDDKVPSRSITGDYYIYSGKKYNNRYMVVKSLEDIYKDKSYVIGYINDSNRV